MICWSCVPLRFQLLLLQGLDKSAQMRSITEVGGQIVDPTSSLLQVFVHPVSEGVRLNLHPQVLISPDIHPLSGRSLGTSCYQTRLGQLLQLLRSI